LGFEAWPAGHHAARVGIGRASVYRVFKQADAG
jgi:hypothetical protein